MSKKQRLVWDMVADRCHMAAEITGRMCPKQWGDAPSGECYSSMCSDVDEEDIASEACMVIVRRVKAGTFTVPAGIDPAIGFYRFAYSICHHRWHDAYCRQHARAEYDRADGAWDLERIAWDDERQESSPLCEGYGDLQPVVDLLCEGRSQSEVARRLGQNRMAVSRSVAKLRGQIRARRLRAIAVAAGR